MATETNPSVDFLLALRLRAMQHGSGNQATSSILGFHTSYNDGRYTVGRCSTRSLARAVAMLDVAIATT